MNEIEIKQTMADIIRPLLEEVLRRHTWMKDGVTYVGNGTFTLKEAQKMLEKDYPGIWYPQP